MAAMPFFDFQQAFSPPWRCQRTAVRWTGHQQRTADPDATTAVNPTDMGSSDREARRMASFKPARSHALRQGRWSEAGRVYLVTFTTRGREPRFVEWDAAALVAQAIASADAWPHARLMCWVLMPDHLHVLIELGNREPLSRAVGRAKAFCSRQWRAQRGIADALWAPGFHDRALRREESLRDAARYIVANPLRAGLVRRVGDYPYWDSLWLSMA